MPNIAVIIPYYQRSQGILRRALDSVLAQKLPPDVFIKVIVVDDGSPSPVEPEIEGLAFVSPFNLTLVQKTNGGVAAARDEGLKHTDGGSDYIAFLDSDDAWEPEHIAQAVTALGRGYDYYFTDDSRVGHHDSHFAYINFPPTDAPAGSLQRLSEKLWVIDKDFYFRFSLRRFTGQISTVVYRRAIHPNAAFHVSLRTVAEDVIFLLDVVSYAKKVCFTSAPCVTCGEGVNIYYSTFGWGDEGHLRRHMASILATYALQSTSKLSPVDARFIERRVRQGRRSFAFFTLRWFLKRRGSWSSELVALTRADPNFRTWYPLALLSVIVLYPLNALKRIRRRPKT